MIFVEIKYFSLAPNIFFFESTIFLIQENKGGGGGEGGSGVKEIARKRKKTSIDRKLKTKL